MTATLRENRVESGQLHDDFEAESPSLDEMLDQTLRAGHDFWIQTIRSSSQGPTGGIYLSTFQTGRGRHLTTLTAGEARVLGERLIRLAQEADAA